MSKETTINLRYLKRKIVIQSMTDYDYYFITPNQYFTMTLVNISITNIFECSNNK